jgi:hypothetical protein
MRKILFLVSISIFTIHSSPQIFTVTDTVTLRSTIFENNTDDYVIKNYGVLTIENCVFKNNTLGSKNSDAIFSNDKIAAPIINYGTLYVSDCRFSNNYSWNTALTDKFAAQASAGAIANFSELYLSNTTFENNTYQKGQFSVIRNESIEQFPYVGNDSVYNQGSVTVENILKNSAPAFQFNAGLIENPVRNKAEIVISSNTLITVNITISDPLGNAVYSMSDNVNGKKIITWNLKNTSGKKVSVGAYSLKIIAIDNSGAIVIKSSIIGVKE